MTWTDLLPLIEHFGQIVFLGGLIFGSQAVARRVQDGKARAEAARIRLMLRLALTGLREVYETNLRLLEQEDGRLASGRNQIGLMRIPLGRLVALHDESQIAAVMAANAAVEAAETAMAMAGQPAGPAVFKLREEAREREAVQLRLTEACTELTVAEASLAAPAEPARSVSRRTARLISGDMPERAMRVPAQAGFVPTAQ